jgi:hypothetical protein
MRGAKSILARVSFLQIKRAGSVRSYPFKIAVSQDSLTGRLKLAAQSGHPNEGHTQKSDCQTAIGYYVKPSQGRQDQLILTFTSLCVGFASRPKIQNSHAEGGAIINKGS